MSDQVSLLVAQAFVGLASAAILFLISSGLNIIFGLLGIVNFAHASMYTLGAYVAFSLVSRTESFWLGLILAPIVVGIFGLILEKFLIRRIYGRDAVYQILLTFGVILVMEDLTRVFWGADPLSVPAQGSLLSSGFEFFGGYVPLFYLFIILMGMLVAAGFIIFLDYTRLGKIIRSVTVNREMASALGINVDKLFTIVFSIGAALAGLGGSLAGVSNTMQPEMGMYIIIEAFAVIVMGGLGNIKGALFGSVIIGLWNSFGVLVFPNFSSVFIYIIMALVLLLKPGGLFSTSEARRA